MLRLGQGKQSVPPNRPQWNLKMNEKPFYFTELWIASLVVPQQARPTARIGPFGMQSKYVPGIIPIFDMPAVCLIPRHQTIREVRAEPNWRTIRNNGWPKWKARA